MNACGPGRAPAAGRYGAVPTFVAQAAEESDVPSRRHAGVPASLPRQLIDTRLVRIELARLRAPSPLTPVTERPSHTPVAGARR
jgi:hypothetical protein